jgi:hypothetical protein
MPNIIKMGGSGGASGEYEEGVATAFSGTFPTFTKSLALTEKPKLLVFGTVGRQTASADYMGLTFIIDVANGVYRIFRGSSGANGANDFFQDVSSWFNVSWNFTGTTINITLTATGDARINTSSSYINVDYFALK